MIESVGFQNLSTDLLLIPICRFDTLVVKSFKETMLAGEKHSLKEGRGLLFNRYFDAMNAT